MEGFKEGLRILTGDIYKIHQENNKYPKSNDLDSILLEFNKMMDELVIKILEKILLPVYKYKHDLISFGKAYDISMLNRQINNDSQQSKFDYAMLDFVNYFNDKKFIENVKQQCNNNKENTNKNKNVKLKPKIKIPRVLNSGFNVKEHSDPGLFALSFLSTNSGLELYDRVEKEWIEIENTQGIWWNGIMSETVGYNNGAFIQSGQHRIRIDEKGYKPRFTGWYELSCNFQAKQSIVDEATMLYQTKKDAQQLVTKLFN